LQLIGGTLASIAAVGAIAGGLVGYWNVWKTLRTDVFPESQKTQREATARPDIVPRLSLVVLPFANLNNDPEQDYFADGITTDLTTDLAQMPGAFVIGRGAALGSAEVAGHMKPSLIALFFIANLLVGCTTSGSNPVADMPSWMGGLPVGAPPRPGHTGL
jgi:hypothetical protein